MPYDPTLDPHYIEPEGVEEDPPAFDAAEYAAIEFKHNVFSKIDLMFRDEGWPLLATWLEERRDAAREALISAKTMESHQLVVGQIKAYDWLAALPKWVAAERDNLGTQLAAMTSEPD